MVWPVQAPEIFCSSDPGKNQEAQTPLVELRGVSFDYQGVVVLEDVHLTIWPGEWVLVVGPNGGGKTTLLKLILGLLTPTAGEVRLFGQSPGKGRHRVGYMPQHMQFDSLFPVTVMDIVLMGRLGVPSRRPLGWYTRQDRQAAQNALAEVGLTGLEDRPFAALSGGQRQRVLIARALCSQPELLLLDEPTAHVDPQAEGQLMEILQHLHRRMSIVMVSHDLGVVSPQIGSVVCVNRRLVVHPTTELTGEKIRRLYGEDVRMIRHDHRCSPEGHQP
ncbi:MAG TPA: ABC transporter ATP-binding protein [Thermoguttaceae bacterium]|nr:ABC transporter ATP-binding protein [Thermoguttaceae bacterium]HPP53918.1 ABC transporter ATP-binding protein [Thermoguttaceae bacterium]